MNKDEILNFLNNCVSLNDGARKLYNDDKYRNCEKIKKLCNEVGFDYHLYKKRRNEKKITTCLICNKEFEIKYLNQKFCSRSCSSTSSNIGRIISDETREKIRKKLYKEKKPKSCPICGSKKCIKSDICKHTKKWFYGIKCFGFNINTIGTINIFDEFEKFKNLLLFEYFENKLSPFDIKDKYSYDKSSENILHIIKSFSEETRNISNSVSNAILQGKLSTAIVNQNTKYKYKSGWHVSWNGKRNYYRSSYELDFCVLLDTKKIDYDTESLRIKYFDTITNKNRIAIPDFYLPLQNKIIEIKSKWTFNKQNMIDKFNQYILLGYNIELIYEHKKYTYNEMIKNL